MSVDRVKGNVAFFCDAPGCIKSLDTDTADFTEARECAKAEGWIIVKVPGDFHHYCSAECQKKEGA
jgi:hypothetical protein